MILSQLLSDEPKRDEACLAQSVLAVLHRAEDLGLGTLVLTLRRAFEAAQAAAESDQGGSLH